MGYDIGFEFKDKADKKKFDEYCKKVNKDPEDELFYARGWDNREFADYLKYLGKRRKWKTDDGYDIVDWIINTKRLKNIVDACKSLEDAGIFNIIDECPDNVDFDDYYYYEILGWKYENQADNLINETDYSRIKDPAQLKAIRMADLEHAETLRQRSDKAEKEFNKKLKAALSGINDDELKYYIKNDLPYSLINLRNVNRMSKLIKKLFKTDKEVIFWESY